MVNTTNSVRIEQEEVLLVGKRDGSCREVELATARIGDEVRVVVVWSNDEQYGCHDHSQVYLFLKLLKTCLRPASSLLLSTLADLSGFQSLCVTIRCKFVQVRCGPSLFKSVQRSLNRSEFNEKFTNSS